MNHHDDDRFDAAMRRRHAAAVAQPSARTRAQLQQRLRAALAGPAAPATGVPRRRWALATAFAAALAIVIGLRPGPHTTPQPAAPAADLAAAPDDGRDPAFDSLLDENPDFYLWLASADADTLAVE